MRGIRLAMHFIQISLYMLEHYIVINASWMQFYFTTIWLHVWFVCGKLVWHEKCVHEKQTECMNDEWSMFENEQKNNNLSHVA